MTTKLTMLATYQTNFAVQSVRDPITKETDIEVVAGEGENKSSEAFSLAFSYIETDGQSKEELTTEARKVAYHALIFALERTVERLTETLNGMNTPGAAPTTFPQGGASA